MSFQFKPIPIPLNLTTFKNNLSNYEISNTTPADIRNLFENCFELDNLNSTNLTNQQKTDLFLLVKSMDIADKLSKSSISNKGDIKQELENFIKSDGKQKDNLINLICSTNANIKATGIDISDLKTHRNLALDNYQKNPITEIFKLIESDKKNLGSGEYDLDQDPKQPFTLYISNGNDPSNTEVCSGENSLVLYFFSKLYERYQGNAVQKGLVEKLFRGEVLTQAELVSGPNALFPVSTGGPPGNNQEFCNEFRDMVLYDFTGGDTPKTKEFYKKIHLVLRENVKAMGVGLGAQLPAAAVYVAGSSIANMKFPVDQGILHANILFNNSLAGVYAAGTVDDFRPLYDKFQQAANSLKSLFENIDNDPIIITNAVLDPILPYNANAAAVTHNEVNLITSIAVIFLFGNLKNTTNNNRKQNLYNYLHHMSGLAGGAGWT